LWPGCLLPGARPGPGRPPPRRDPAVLPRPFLTFSSGYVQRALAMLPKQGSRRPWQVHQNYLLDLLRIRYGRIADGVMRFSAAGAQS
jgi:monooxygenase